ncbi:VPS9 domain [Phytophthora cactorum]|nr:VPS9 domain [Phytophthora cactorum]
MEQHTGLPSPALDELLRDEDYAELALEPAAVDRLMGGQCLVEQLSHQDATQRKRRRVPTVNADMELQDPDNDEQPEQDTLCCLSDVEDTDEDAEDGADALIAAFGSEDQNQNQTHHEQTALRRKKLPHTSSASAMRVCRCGRVSRCSLMEDEAFDPHSASREYLDLHIRYAVVVRVVRVETVEGHALFVLKVSDAETQKRWEVRKTLKEMMQFYSQIQQISLVDAPVKRPLWGTFRGLRRFRLPKKFFHFRGSLNTQRRVVFDSFLRQTAALVAPAPLGPRRRKAVLLLQEFVVYTAIATCLIALVAEIFATSSHKVSWACESFVAVLTSMSRDDKHSFMPERKARTLLNTVSRKMGEIKDKMLQDEVLLGQLAIARSERSEPDYDEFLDEVKHAVCGFVQKHVLVPLEDHVHEALNTLSDWEDENALKDKIKVLQTKPQSFFGVPPHVVAGSGSDWEDARRELRRVNEYALPLDKLKCLARAAGAIFQTCGSSRSPSSVGTTSSLTSIEELDLVLRPSMTTDEFISVHLFVLVMSNMSQLLITREFLRIMCDPQDITGELGYYLTTFEVAVDLLTNHSDPQQPMLPTI